MHLYKGRCFSETARQSENGISIDMAIVALTLMLRGLLLDAHTRLYYLHLPYANYALDDS